MSVTIHLSLFTWNASMRHNRKIGPAVPFIHDSRHEVVGDHNARTVLIGRPTQEPNRIHFKSIRQFYIPKTKIYNLQPHFVRSSQENNASMSLSEKSCTLLHHGSGLPANMINIDPLSLSLKLSCSLKIKGLIACSMQQLSASFDISLHLSTCFPISSTFKQKKRWCFRSFPGFNIS